LSQLFKLSANARVEQLWRDQEGLCAKCREPMLKNRFEAPHARIWTKRRATLDHIVPVSKGGTDVAENLQLMHARCNKIKGNRT
jgi:5-methylcytosine-specific restriction endonuclease McrA